MDTHNDTQGAVIGQTAPGHKPGALDWERLVSLEPRLDGLLKEAKSIAKNPKSRRRAPYAWYGWGSSGGGLKAKLVALIGFERGWSPERYPENVVVDLFYWPQRPKVERNEDDALLYSPGAYHLAYQKLYRACGC